MPRHRDITPREEVFAQAYCDYGNETFSNATKSARKAKYAEKHVGQTGSQLLKNCKIKERINKLVDEKLEKMGFNENTVLLGIIHDQRMAREAGEWSTSNACSKLLGEFFAIFKQKAIIEHKPVSTGAERMTDAERAASIRAAEAYKLHLAVDGDEIKGVRNLVKPTTLPEPIEVEQEPEQQEPEPIAITERTPAHLVGKGPGKPAHSLSTFE